MSEMGWALTALPAFSDNYIWGLSTAGQAWVVDPGDAEPVIEWLEQERLQLAGILLTHHHGDHCGGIATLRRRWPVPVYAAHTSSVPELVTHPVGEGDVISLLAGCSLQVLAVPGHTLDHLAFYSVENSWLFCGDTLFSAGCGRLFEGTPTQMHASLQKLAALPDATLVCCAHEYTLANLRFAEAVEPENEAIAVYRQACEHRRAQGEATLPASLGNERQVNPFLRCGIAAVKASAEHFAGQCLQDELAVFAVLRQWKNVFA